MAKFCTKCGRKLEEGEVCTCTSENQESPQQIYAQPPQTEEYGSMAGSMEGQRQDQSRQQGQYYNPNQQNQYYNQSQQGGQYYDPNQQNQYYNQGQQSGQYYDPNQQSQYYNQEQQGGQYYDPNQQSQYYNQGQQGGQYYDPNQQNPYYNQSQQGQYYNQNQQGPYNNQGQYYQGNGQYQQQRTKEAEWLYNKKDQLVAGTKNMFSEILPILKAPVTRVKEIADSNNPAVGIEFIATKMVVCLLFLLIVLLKIRGAVSGYSSYIDIKIPYLKSILCVILATAGIDVIDALLLKVITALFGAKASFQAYIDVVGATDMFAIFIIIIEGILIGIAPEIALVFFGILAPLVTYIQFAQYRAVADIDEDKKPYAYFIAKLCFTIITGLVVYLLVRSTLNSMAGGLINSLGDIFNML